MKKLCVLDLFSGIGGFSLGLERTGGFETVAFCEIEPYCRKVLNKHWPKVPIYEDVKTLTAEQLRADGIAVDVICGGFPCQDISFAGKGAGIDGERSGLWSEYARIIGELRPRYVFVENVAALLSRGLDRVLGDLASLGFDAEWHCIPASAVGAPHRRDRIWIVAHPQHDRVSLGRGVVTSLPESGNARRIFGNVGSSGEQQAQPILAHSESERRREAREYSERHTQRTAGGGEVLANSSGLGRSRSGLLTKWCRPEANGARQAAHALSGGQLGEWSTEPNVGRVANGVPSRVDRLRSLGNAVVPQIPELIGYAILESLKEKQEAA